MSLTPQFFKKTRYSCILLFLGLVSALTSQAQTTWYSLGTGNFNTLSTWTNSPTHVGGTSPASTLALFGATGNSTFIIGNGHTVTLASGATVTASAIIIGDGTGVGTLIVGDNSSAAAAGLTLANAVGGGNALTINAGSTMRTAAFTGHTHTFSCAVDFTNLGTFDMVGASTDRTAVTFNAVAGQTVIATGVNTNFWNLTIGSNTAIGNTSNTATTFNVRGNITVNALATLRVGGDGGATHQVNLYGNLTNNGTYNMINVVGASSDVVNTSFIGTTQTIDGVGETFYNVTSTGTTSFRQTSGTTSFQDLTVSSGTTTLGNTTNVNFSTIVNDAVVNNGTLNVRSTGTGTLSATFTGGITNTGSFSLGNTTATSTAAVTVVMNGTINNSGATFSINNTTNGPLTVTGAANIINTNSFTIGNNGTGAFNSTFGSVDNNGNFRMGGNGNTSSSFTFNGDITNTGTFRPGGDGTGTASHTLNIGADFTNTGTFSLSGNSTNDQFTTVAFVGAGDRTFSHPAVLTFQNLTMNATGGPKVTFDQNIIVSGVMTFTNGILVPGTDMNLTMTRSATFSGTGNASSYLLLDGSTSANGSLFVTYNSTTPNWSTTFPVGTATGGWSRVQLGSMGGTAPVDNAVLAVKPIFNASIQGHLRRTFRLTVSGNANATTSIGTFYYNNPDDISAGDVAANYDNIWILNSGVGNWTSLVNTITQPTPALPAKGVGSFSPSVAQPLTNGIYYYTLGASTAYPNTWYSYQTGVWSDWQNWTLDPSGTTLVNGLNLPPQPGDEIVILNGFTITNDVSGQVVSNTTIQGGATLDMVATTGNTLGGVSGSGILRINNPTLPGGSYTAFVATAGGTIEYYNTGGALSASQTVYNKLKLTNSTTSDITYVTASNLTINSTLDITATNTGKVTWQINDGSAAQRTITLLGDVTVSANGRIRVGTGNEGTGTTQPHDVKLYGNLINNGSIKFFDDTDTEFSDTPTTGAYATGTVYTNAVQGNAANVTMSGSNNATITCNGQTDFYRLTLNKGTGQQAVLTVNSSNTANFRLFGPSNLFSSGTQPNVISNCALSIVNGTLQLTGTINIPALIVNGSAGAPTDVFSIPQNGALWINGSNVTVNVTNNLTSNDDQRLQVNGLLRLTNGTLNCGYSRGIGSYTGGVVLVEGGLLNMWQYRPVLGGSNVFVYIQKGGTVNVGTAGAFGNGTQALAGVTDAITGQFARFSLPTTTSSFQMSGGVLNIGTPSQNSTTTGAEAIDIQSAVSNYNVTGGTVNMYIPYTAGYDFGINSTAPFYNVNVYRPTVTGTAGSNVAELNQALTVLNNFTIATGNSPVFNCAAKNFTVGGNFDIQASTTFNLGTGGTGTNTITFNGTGAQSWTYNGTLSNLSTVVLSKTTGTTLTLGGSGTFPNITVALNLSSGILADGGKAITVTGSLTNSAVHSGAGSIIYNNAGISTIAGSGGTFGNLTIQTSATISTAGPQTVTGNLRLLNTNTTLNIGNYNLKVLGGIYSDGGTGTGFTGTQRIQTAGLPNDDGLTRQATTGVDLLFPFGTTTVTYSPVTINAVATTAGLITVNPVAGAHPNVTTTGQSVRYYWKVTSSGFAGLSSVTHKSYTYNGALRDAASATYRPARYDQATFTWAYGPTYIATSGGGTTAIPNFNTGSGWTVLSSDVLDGEYTAGNLAAFGPVMVFYSSSTPTNWSAPSSWSTVAVGAAGGAGPPCNTCPVVIGNGVVNHTIVNDADGQSCGSLQINTGSALDCNTRAGLNFGVNNRGVVSGRGKIRISSGVFPAGDFSDFIGSNGGTVEWYGNMTTIPTAGSSPQSIPLTSYYNLILSPNAGVTMTMPNLSTTPNANLIVYNNFTITGGAGSVVATSSTIDRTLTIGGDFKVTSGTFNILATQTTNLVVNGNTTIGAAGTLKVNNGGGNRLHTFVSSGDFVNNGTVLFRGGNELVNLTFNSTTDNVLTTNGTTTLNLLTVDKGTSQAPTLTINGSGTMNVLTTGWLILSDGTVNFNFAGTAGPTTPGPTTPGTFSLNTANSPFNIVSTAKLKVSNGTVNVVTANNSAADLTLAGGIEVTGGTMNIGAAANTTVNNDIEYAAAGLPSITVSGGTLNVYGSIRRATATLSGALVYNQSGGTVLVAGTAANNTRGVFEIENNAGSVFNLTGTSLLQIQRTTGGTGFADLYVIPTSSTVSATSTIEMGISGGIQSMSYNVSVPIGNFTIIGGASLAANPPTQPLPTPRQTVTMYSNPMIASGNLLINNGAGLNTNSLDVFVGGNFTTAVGNTTNISDGVYNGANNTTTFNGSGAQLASLSGTSTFLNMTVNKPAGTVTLSGTAPTLNNLNILSGTLDVGTMNLAVNKDITNNSFQTGSGVVTLAGAASTHAIYSTNGSFTNLTLGATTAVAATKLVTVYGNMTVLGNLTFGTTNRYLYIKSNRLTFGVDAAVVGASTTAFIRTSGVSSDLGVVKNWKTNASAASFTYAVGTRVNYTPVVLTLTVSSPGAYTIIPVDDQHPTADAMGELILNYYWIGIKDASLAYGAGGSHTYQYPKSLIGGSGGTYVGAYLDAINLIGWTTTPPTATFADATPNTSSIMTFNGSLNASMPGASGEFHYTAGTAGLNHTLPNPIQAVYSRFSDANGSNPTTAATTGANWNLATNWTLATDGKGTGLSTVPVGRPIVILTGATMYMNIPGLRAFRSTINGLMVVTNQSGTVTTGHNLGTINGTGTLQVKSSTLPAGNYTAFVSAAGGTIEYNGTMAMNNRAEYNNVSIKGGTVTMTNTDITLNGSMTIATGAALDNTANNRNMSVAKNFTTVGTGSFSPGTGTVTFTGGTNSVISGPGNTLYGLEVAKTGMATVSSGNPIFVDGPLTMTSGIYISTAANILTVTATGTSSGGSATSYVTGPMRKTLLAGGNFIFPSGSTVVNRYRAVGLYNATADDTWTILYVGNNPTFDGYSYGVFNANFVKKVSMFEYWMISRTGSAGADVELMYSTGSYIANPTNVGNTNNLRVVHWDGTQWDEPVAGGTYSQTGDNITGSVRANGVMNFSPFTLGSLDINSPLPVKWGPVEATRVNGAVVVKWVTLQEQDNDHFEVERSEDGTSFTPVGAVAGAGNSAVKLTYTFTDTQASAANRYYYRIRQIDYHGVSDYSPLVVVTPAGGVEGAEKSWIAYPNPLAKNVAFVLSRTDNVAPEQVHVTLYSAQGILVYDGSGSLQEVNTEINGYLQEAHSGVYVLQVSDGTLTRGFKIVRP